MSTVASSQTPSPVPVRVAIIGGGFGALMAYAVLRFRGVAREEIRVVTPDASPERSWERFVRAINLQSLRSESIAHFYPTDSPGLATMEAFTSWSIRPLIQSWFDRYHPTVDGFIRHTQTIARQTGFYHSILRAMVGEVVRHENSFELRDEDGETLTTAQHIILAVGHGQLHIPGPVTAYREMYGADDRVVTSYEEKSYAPPQTVLVVGDGLTAGTEWSNILTNGGRVLALSLTGFVVGQPLNTPRRYFSRRGILPYRRKEASARLQELRAATRGTVPAYPHWMRLFERAQREGRFELSRGTLMGIERTEDGALRCTIRLPDGHAVQTVRVHRVISAAGFYPPSTHPLLARLIAEYDIPTMDGIPEVTDNFCLENLSTPTSCAAVIGPAAAWAIPSADSLGGMKIVAHHIANLICGQETWSPRELAVKTARWTRLVTGRELP